MVILRGRELLHILTGRRFLQILETLVYLPTVPTNTVYANINYRGVRFSTISTYPGPIKPLSLLEDLCLICIFELAAPTENGA
jgi:hypothetical protein